MECPIEDYGDSTDALSQKEAAAGTNVPATLRDRVAYSKGVDGTNGQDITPGKATRQQVDKGLCQERTETDVLQ